jgi:hypothetical protein
MSKIKPDTCVLQPGQQSSAASEQCPSGESSSATSSAASSSAASSSAASSSAASSSAAPAPPDITDHSHRPNFAVAEIAGIVVAGVLIFALAACMFLTLGRRKWNKKTSEAMNNRNRQSTVPSFYSPTVPDRVSDASPPIQMAEHLYNPDGTPYMPVRGVEYQYQTLPPDGPMT